MKVAFLGGGTGGHLAPGIGVAEILEHEGHETLFLVAGREVEKAMLAPRRLSSQSLFGEGGRPPLHRVDAWVRATKRMKRAVAEFDPDVVDAFCECHAEMEHILSAHAREGAKRPVPATTG